MIYLSKFGAPRYVAERVGHRRQLIWWVSLTNKVVDLRRIEARLVPATVQRQIKKARHRTTAALAAAALVLAATGTQAETFRDASGRAIGTATRDANGQTTFRDASGRMTGTATRDSNGTTTFRDGSGRITGTTERRR
jgi:hypothetical protein